MVVSLGKYFLSSLDHHSPSPISDHTVIISSIVKGSLFPTKIKPIFLSLTFRFLYGLPPSGITITMIGKSGVTGHVPCQSLCQNLHFLSYHNIYSYSSSCPYKYPFWGSFLIFQLTVASP